MKRCFDVLVSALLLIILAIPMLIIAVLVRVKIGKPVLFSQQRPGRHGKIFLMVKFRTMSEDRDPEGVLLEDALRLGSFGRFLRSTSLDELPELWNVVKGDMSLVGPRPLLVKYLDRYTERQARRHHVRPGLTGWAQVNGRNALSWEDRFDLDLWYVENQSLKLDIQILCLTVKKVFLREDICAAGEATMAEFMGSKLTKIKQTQVSDSKNNRADLDV